MTFPGAREFGKLRTLRAQAPHPDSPAGRSFDWSSLALPHPYSPAGRSFDWSYVGVPHPYSPDGRQTDWRFQTCRIEHRDNCDLAKQADNLEDCLVAHAHGLRDILPDSSLRTIYDRQLGPVKGKRFSGADPDLVTPLRKLQFALAWFEGDSHVLAGSGTELKMAMSKAGALRAYGITIEKKKELLQEIGALAAHGCETANRTIREEWNEAKRTGKDTDLVAKWKMRMLQRSAYESSTGSAQGTADKPQEERLLAATGGGGPSAPVKTWVEFQLVDDEMSPVPNARYTVTLPDGSVRNGRLSEQGIVRFDGIISGQCEFTLTDFQSDEWQEI